MKVRRMARKTPRVISSAASSWRTMSAQAGAAVEQLAQGLGAQHQQPGVGLELVEETVFARQERVEPPHAVFRPPGIDSR